MQRFENFQMPQRGVIKREEFRAAIERKPREMFHVPPQILCEVMQRAARRADGRRAILQPEAVERCDFEMVAHGVERGLRRERPVIVAAQDLK